MFIRSKPKRGVTAYIIILRKGVYVGGIFRILWLNIHFGDHVYVRHLSTECRSILSADMATDTLPIYRPTLGRYVGRDSVARRSTWTDKHVGRHPTDTSPPLDRHSADTRPPLGRHSAATRLPLGRHSAATRPPLGRYFINTRPTLSSLGQLVLPPEFYLPCSTERGFQWPLSCFGL